jgi:DNA-binding protein YbaB
MGSTEGQGTPAGPSFRVDADQARETVAALDSARYTGTVEYGRVVVEVDGRGKLISIEIDPDLGSSDYSKVASWILTALQDARKAARDDAMQAMESLVGDPDAFVEQASAAISWLPEVEKS